jgi:hypothetical protein
LAYSICNYSDKAASPWRDGGKSAVFWLTFALVISSSEKEEDHVKDGGTT